MPQGVRRSTAPGARGSGTRAGEEQVLSLRPSSTAPAWRTGGWGGDAGCGKGILVSSSPMKRTRNGAQRIGPETTGNSWRGHASLANAPRDRHLAALRAAVTVELFHREPPIVFEDLVVPPEALRWPRARSLGPCCRVCCRGESPSASIWWRLEPPSRVERADTQERVATTHGHPAPRPSQAPTWRDPLLTSLHVCVSLSLLCSD
jgi:hypothetical protein